MLLAVFKALSLILVLYLPGHLWRRAFYRGGGLVGLYEALTISALWSGWLALLLAELGAFSLPLHLALTLLASGAAALLGRRRAAPLAAPDQPARPWERLVYAIGLLAFALLMARPFETILGAKDAGVYANTGYAIARSGSLVLHDPLIAALGHAKQSAHPKLREAAAHAESNLLGKQDRERFLATRLRQPGFYIFPSQLEHGRVVPQFFHLYPAWIGLFTAGLGLYGGLAATGYLALLGMWSVALLGRRLAGPLVGALTLGFLGANALQVWFGRYSTSESTAQALLFAGLAAFAVFSALPAEQRRGRAGRFYGLFAGVALGQLALARIDFFWGVGPVLLYLLYCAVSRRWSAGHTAFAAGLAAMLTHAGLHMLLIARPYFIDTGFARFQDFAITAQAVLPLLTPLLREVYHTNSRAATLLNPWRLWLELAVLLELALLLLALWRRPGLLAWVERQARRYARPLLLASAGLILLLAAYAYLLRPGVLSLQVLAHPLQQRLLLESYVGAPLPLPEGLPAKRATDLGNMVRLGWYLSPLGVALGVAGFVLWWVRGFDRRTWIVLIIGLLYSAFYIRALYGTSDRTYLYILRRFVPGAIPAFSLAAAYAVAALWQQRRRALRLLGAGCAGLLLLFLLVTGRGIYAHVEYRGAIEQIGALAGRLEPDAVVLLRGGALRPVDMRDVPAEIATPLIYAFERDALVVGSEAPWQYAEPLTDQVLRWLGQGRPVYLLLGANGGSLVLPGLGLEQLETFELRLAEWQQLHDQKPKLAAEKLLQYTLYRVRPAPLEPEQAAGVVLPNDYAAQLGGFHRLEYDRAGRPYAWITSAALRLPALPLERDRNLTLRLAAGQRPPAIGASAQVCPRLAAGPGGEQPLPVALPCLQVGPEPADYTLTLPPLPDVGPVLLILEGSTWIPARDTAALPPEQRIADGRELLVQFYGLWPSAAAHSR